MSTRSDALGSLVKALGWEPESDTTAGLVRQLSRMIDVEGGAVSVKEPPAYVARIGKVGYASLDNALACAKGRVVRLLADIEGGITVPSGVRATIDMDGHTVTATETAIDNSGILTVTGGTVVSTGSFAILSRSGAQTTVENCVVRSVEGAVITGKARGTRITVRGCDMHASDNAVVAGNGSEGFGGNVVDVYASKLTGGITSPGYVACGVYCPTDDVMTLDGCVISVEGGCGVCSRAGRVTARRCSITTTGTTTGKVGDSRVVVPCSALVFDAEADYPSLSDDDGIVAYGCELESEVETAVTVGDGDRIEVS